jgi:hypothetical protein
MTHLMASNILLFPHPLGPTTAEMPDGKEMTDLSGKVLKPYISSCFKRIGCTGGGLGNFPEKRRQQRIPGGSAFPELVYEIGNF